MATQEKKNYTPSEGVGKKERFLTEEEVYNLVLSLLQDSAAVIRIKSGYIQSGNYQNNFKGWRLDNGGIIDAEVISMVNLTSLPGGPSEVGDMCVHSGKLKICTVAGTPGTWTIVGTQT